jgi:hypothetical protein
MADPCRKWLAYLLGAYADDQLLSWTVVPSIARMILNILLCTFIQQRSHFHIFRFLLKNDFHFDFHDNHMSILLILIFDD